MLRTKTPLKRVQFVSRKRKPDITSSVRQQVRERSEGTCEVQAQGCKARAIEMHHRKRRSQGGEHVALNLIHACTSCHGLIHREVAWAKEHGYLA